MALTVRLRPATTRDLHMLTEIENRSFPDPSWSASDFLRYDCVVAEVSTDGDYPEIAGFIVSRQTAAAEGNTPPEREILNLAVAEPFRRKGIATLLLRGEMQAEAYLFLEVRESNVKALQLYIKEGFIEIGRRSNYYDNPVESAIVMRMKWC